MKRHRKRRANRRHKKLKALVRLAKAVATLLEATEHLRANFPSGGIVSNSASFEREAIVPKCANRLNINKIK